MNKIVKGMIIISAVLALLVIGFMVWVSTIPSTTRIYIACDIDDDRDCDDADIDSFERSLGSCVGDTMYSTLADADHNECVTEEDREIAFGEWAYEAYELDKLNQ